MSKAKDVIDLLIQTIPDKKVLYETIKEIMKNQLDWYKLALEEACDCLPCDYCYLSPCKTGKCEAEFLLVAQEKISESKEGEEPNE